MADTTSNALRPGALTRENNQFALSSAEWYSIQVYIEQGAALPITMDKMQAWVGSDHPMTAELEPDCNLLLAEYATVVSHCVSWKKDLYSGVVSLADHIVEYNQEVPDLYSALKDTLVQLLKAMQERDAEAITSAQKDFQDLLSDRVQSAENYASYADDLATRIGGFVTMTEGDQTRLQSLKQDFDTKYGSESAVVVELTRGLAAEQANLNSAMVDFVKDMLIAETSPAYSWVPFVGIIATVVVASVYAQRAAEAAQKMADARNKIAEIGGEIARDMNIMYVVNFADSSIGSVLDHLKVALPLVERIRDAWKTIAADLDQLSQLLGADAEAHQLPADGIDTAIQEWAEIAQKANTFRANAFITVTGSAVAA